jgi:hypothetical protein
MALGVNMLWELTDALHDVIPPRRTDDNGLIQMSGRQNKMTPSYGEQTPAPTDGINNERAW